MFKTVELDKYVTIDIECVTGYKNIYELERIKPNLYKIFQKRFEKDINEVLKNVDSVLEAEEKVYKEKAVFMAEFSKIICICVAGYLNGEIQTKSFLGNEKDIISKFYTFIAGKPRIICGHNIVKFDIPFINKRAYLYNIQIPSILQIHDKKPWELSASIRDTQTLWAFGGMNNISLELLCEFLGIETSKDDIDGSQVDSIYYIYNDIDRIVQYCTKDVTSNLLVIKRLCN